MYDNGCGVAQNYVMAYMWFSLAAAMGDRDAARNRDIDAAKLTPASYDRSRV
jgi:TPR repeat protein